MARITAILVVALLSFQIPANEIEDMKEILNFYQITENIGTAGQPTADQFSEIARAGYSTVINLAMHDSSNAIAEEGHIVTSLGMTYIHIPVPWDAPSVKHVKKFFDVMDVLENEKIFVHCAANYRVSVFMHQYLTFRKEVPSAQATSPILQTWLPDMDDNWKRIMALDPEGF